MPIITSIPDNDVSLDRSVVQLHDNMVLGGRGPR